MSLKDLKWIALFCTLKCNECKSPLPLWKSIRENGYDKYVSPTAEWKNATVVKIAIFFESLSSIQATTMDFKLDFYLMTKWYDPRLAHEGEDYIVTHDMALMDELWHPDIYFTNSKTAEYQYITIPNMLLRIYPDGSTYESRRVRVTASCMMNLSKYPMDEQLCMLRMLSYSHTVEQLLFLWDGDDAFSGASDIELPEFQILSLATRYCNATYSSGNYSCLEGEFVIKRLSGYHLFQTFMPSGSIVCISWITFWINPEAVPARVTLSITTLLTLATMSSGVRASLPPVSYTKAIDIWMMVCMTFVIMALLEFTIVNTMVQRDKRIRELSAQACRRDLNDPEDAIDNEGNIGGDLAAGDSNSLYKQFKLNNQRNSTVSSVNSFKTLDGKSDKRFSRSDDEKTATGKSKGPRDEYNQNVDVAVRPKSAKQSLKQKWFTYALSKGGSSLALDYISRWGFPLAFLGFNILYWSKFTPRF